MQPIYPANKLKKYADDTYLLVPASSRQTSSQELQSIKDCGECNNLALNISKCQEMILTKPRSRNKVVLPAPIEGIERFHVLKILGVSVTENLSFKPHIDDTIAACNRGLYA